MVYKRTMFTRLLPVVLLLTASAWAQGADKGWCPPFSTTDRYKISQVGPMPPASPQVGAEYLGTAGFLATVSDRGYVCEAKVVRSVNQRVDEAAGKTARDWRFHAARVGRERVATVVVINVPVWRKPDGTLLTSEGITVESPPGTVPRRP